MSIMEKMRGSTDSTPMQVVLVLIVIAFVGWFAVPQGDQVYVVVEVNGERVLQQEFGRRYRVEKQIREIQQGRTMEGEAEKAFAEEVKQAMARELVIEQKARKMGFVVADAEMASQIRSDSRFQGEDGTFQRTLYDDEVTRRSRGDVESEFRDAVLRRKLQSAIALGTTIDPEQVKKDYIAELGTVDLDYVRVEPMLIRAAFPVTDADRASWLSSNGDKVQAEYDRDKAAKYDIPEQLQLSVVRLDVGVDDNEEELKLTLSAARNQAASGGDFDAIARKWSEDPTVTTGGDMGLRRVNTITQDVRDAVKDVAVGDVSPVVKEDGALAFYKVNNRIAARLITLDEVRTDIADRMIYAERAKTYADELQASWSADPLPPFSKLGEIGVGLLPLTGVIPTQYPGGFGQPPRELVEQVKTVEVGQVLPAHAVDAPGGTEYFIVKVSARNVPDMQYIEPFRMRALSTERKVVWDAYGAALEADAEIGFDQQAAQESFLQFLWDYLPQ